jgi:mono/diheme cytochrome c family protein/rhodanese-related sulfurtransferase
LGKQLNQKHSNASRQPNVLTCLFAFVVSMAAVAAAGAVEGPSPIRTLTAEQSVVAAANYEKYCVLCHGAERQGYINDHAPSLRSKSLFESGIPHAVLRTLSYGRPGTPMGGYLDEVGGPLSLDETWDLTYWLFEQSGAERVAMSTEAVLGDIERGEVLYQQECSVCHGENGEGITAPAIGNSSALAYNSDEFIRYAIRNGREDTGMIAFSEKLPAADIDNITAFIRSRAGGWEQQQTVLQELPTPDQYVINKDGEDPEFELTDGIFVSAADLYKALQEKRKMMLLDTRVTSVWQTAHIEGSFTFPYYSNFDAKVVDLPKDVMVVAYCSCPRAAAEWVVDELRQRDYEKTAVLYEGIYGWINLGYPVMRGDIREQHSPDTD